MGAASLHNDRSLLARGSLDPLGAECFEESCVVAFLWVCSNVVNLNVWNWNQLRITLHDVVALCLHQQGHNVWTVMALGNFREVQLRGRSASLRLFLSRRSFLSSIETRQEGDLNINRLGIHGAQDPLRSRARRRFVWAMPAGALWADVGVHGKVHCISNTVSGIQLLQSGAELRAERSFGAKGVVEEGLRTVH